MTLRKYTIRLGRDPYARTETKRKTIRTKAGCDWCGQNQNERLFYYYVESDNLRQSEIKGFFCNIECCRAYHHQ